MLGLGYIGIASSRLDDWQHFATGLLGMQSVDRAGGVRAFRMDDRSQRLVVTDTPDEGLAFLGWEVADAAALSALAERLQAHGVAVQSAPRRLAEERHVADLIVFADPAGNRLEVFHGPAIASDPFQPGRPISGFRTGPLGMGHAVLHTADVDGRFRIRASEITESIALLRGLLGNLPDGPLSVALSMASGEGIGWAEGFRGDIWHWLRLDAGQISAVFMRDPSWLQWPLLQAAIHGNIVADFPLCNKSFNCSYSGVDL